jgi:hypothetical protein
MTSTRLAVVLVAATFSCGGGSADDEDGEGSATETADTGMTDPTMPTASADDTMGDTVATTPGDPDCGNGIMEEFEECDDGEANSDAEPEACRTNCRLPWCGDGVHDMAEECDDGGENNNLEPNACRVECLLPICGDSVPDKGEACDDGDAEWGGTCFECSSLFYFVLNAPEGGADSIVRSSRDGTTVRIVGDEPDYDGMLQIAIEPEGTMLYALQTAGSVHRVLFFDPGSGELTAEADLGAAVLGYEPTLWAMALAGDGLLYVALEGQGTTRLVTVDPATQLAAQVLDFATDLEVADMTAAGSDALFITTGGGNSIERVELAGFATSTFADGSDSLANPIAITYDASTDLLWVANNPGGVADIVQFDQSGAVTPFNPVAGYNDPFIHGLEIDTGMVVLATVQNADAVVSIGILGGVVEFFTEMIEAPVDIEIVDLLN